MDYVFIYEENAGLLVSASKHGVSASKHGVVTASLNLDILKQIIYQRRAVNVQSKSGSDHHIW